MISRSSHFFRIALPAALAAVSMLLSGCGEDDGLPRLPVSGSVTLDGEPLATGSIQFQPEATVDSVSVSGGAPIEDGRYRIEREKGLVPGTYKVVILSHDNRVQIEEDVPGGGIKLPPELIPPKYNVQTTLVAKVEADKENVFDFTLEKK